MKRLELWRAERHERRLNRKLDKQWGPSIDLHEGQTVFIGGIIWQHCKVLLAGRDKRLFWFEPVAGYDLGKFMGGSHVVFDSETHALRGIPYGAER